MLALNLVREQGDCMNRESRGHKYREYMIMLKYIYNFCRYDKGNSLEKEELGRQCTNYGIVYYVTGN